MNSDRWRWEYDPDSEHVVKGLPAAVVTEVERLAGDVVAMAVSPGAVSAFPVTRVGLRLAKTHRPPTCPNCLDAPPVGTTSPAGEDATTAEQQPDPNSHWAEAVVVQPAAMRQTGIVVMPNDDPQLLAAVRRYVMPDRRYMKLHGWNLKHMDDQRRHEFGRSLALDAAEIRDSDLIVLLRGEWRARLTASWLIGMSLRTRFREILGTLLVDSDGCNDRKGICFAFTRFGDSCDAEVLASYLRRSLSPGTPRCAQDWAMGGLLHLADQEEAPCLDDLQGPEGAWLQWLGSNQEPDTKDLVDFPCAFADSHALPEPVTHEEEGVDLARSCLEWRPRPTP